MKDADLNVSYCAVDALGKIGSEQALLGLLKLVEDANHHVRWSVAHALGEIGSEQALPALLKLLENVSPTVCKWAVNALGKIGSEQAIPALLKLVEDADSEVRQNVADALGKIGSEQAIPALLQLLEDTDSSVCWRAEDALRRTAKQYANEIAPYLPHLLTLISTESGEYADRTIRAIQENCKYYNYEIFQSHLAAQKADRPTNQTSDRPITYEVNAEVVQIVENNYGTIHGKQTP